MAFDPGDRVSAFGRDGCLFAIRVCATMVEGGGPGYLNALVMLFAWNAISFAVMGVVSLPMRLCLGIASDCDSSSRVTACTQQMLCKEAARRLNAWWREVGPKPP
ncbi:hypothetical protein NOCA250087 [metagenome]|uniref:Uncharacterized protein n=1 Tax=metagenome TaxID=256318 RepID=A0A2P2C936_9ZZZZ